MVVFDRELCIGASICSVVCSQFWKIANDGKAELLGSKLDPKTGKYEIETDADPNDLADLKKAENSCPAQVIKIIETGK